MQAQLTVRLPEHLNREVAAAAKKMHLKRADVVRIALEKFLSETAAAAQSRPYDAVQHLTGSISTGMRDLGESHRKHLIRKILQRA